MPKAYVVFVGLKPGVYEKWSDASAQVTGFSCSCHKGYDSKREAEAVFASFRNLRVDDPPSQQHQGSTSTTSTGSAGSTQQHQGFTSTTSAGSTHEVLRSRKLAQLLQEQSDLARVIASNSFKMERLCAEIRAILQEMREN